ncbi:hypothetical protein CR513_50602, partial [Mucuna pruriens]
MFIKSIDAFEFMKTGDKVYQLLNSLVEEIGEKDVIQVVTDNGSNYVMASYIYTHSMALNIMRKFTNKSKLVRHGVTRFAATFLSVAKIAQAKGQS